MLLFERLALFEKYYSHQNILNPRSHAGLSVLNTVPYIKNNNYTFYYIWGGEFCSYFWSKQTPSFTCPRF